jgi:hypothetical protein
VENFRGELSMSWKTSGENYQRRGKLPGRTINAVEKLPKELSTYGTLPEDSY